MGGEFFMNREILVSTEFIAAEPLVPDDGPATMTVAIIDGVVDVPTGGDVDIECGENTL